jgi:hypothetical protein
MRAIHLLPTYQRTYYCGQYRAPLPQSKRRTGEQSARFLPSGKFLGGADGR